MSKLDKLRESGRGNAAESMGAGVLGRTAPGSALHGATALGPAAAPAHLQGVARNKDAAVIPVAKIGADPDQPREEFDAEDLQQLSESLRTRGQIQPISVYWDEGRGLYVIVCGERRWRAAGLAGMTTMTATVLSRKPEAGERLAIQLIENLLRADLKPVEQAKGYRQLMSINGWSAAQLTRELAVSESKVTRALALLDLPPAVQDRVERGILPPATAYEISKVPDRSEQEALADRVVSEKLTRQDTARAVQEKKHAGAGKKKAPGEGVTQATVPVTRRAEFATPHGHVTVVGTEGSIVPALEHALARARAERDGAAVMHDSEAA